MLTDQTRVVLEVDTETGVIFAEQRRVILDDGVAIAQTTHRTLHEPTDDATAIGALAVLHPTAARVAAQVWTPDVVSAFADAQTAQAKARAAQLTLDTVQP